MTRVLPSVACKVKLAFEAVQLATMSAVTVPLVLTMFEMVTPLTVAVFEPLTLTSTLPSPPSSVTVAI